MCSHNQLLHFKSSLYYGDLKFQFNISSKEGNRTCVCHNQSSFFCAQYWNMKYLKYAIPSVPKLEGASISETNMIIAT